MLKAEKIKSCAADRYQGGRIARDLFSAQIVYIPFSSGEIRDEGGEAGEKE